MPSVSTQDPPPFPRQRSPTPGGHESTKLCSSYQVPGRAQRGVTAGSQSETLPHKRRPGRVAEVRHLRICLETPPAATVILRGGHSQKSSERRATPASAHPGRDSVRKPRLSSVQCGACGSHERRPHKTPGGVSGGRGVTGSTRHCPCCPLASPRPASGTQCRSSIPPQGFRHIPPTPPTYVCDAASAELSGMAPCLRRPSRRLTDR